MASYEAINFVSQTLERLLGHMDVGDIPIHFSPPGYHPFQGKRQLA